MPRLTLTLCALLLACGGPTPRTDPTLEPRPSLRVEPRPEEEPALQALLAAEDPRAAVDALSSPELTRLADHIPEAHPAWGWAQLARARLEAHTRRRGLAIATLERALERAAAHPAREEAAALLARLKALGAVTPNRIGVLLPLSGRYKRIGEVAMKAIQLSRRKFPRVQLRFADTQGDARVAAREVERLVLEEQVGAIIGPVGGIESWEAAIAAERLEVPLVTLTAREGICRLGGFIFRHRLTRSTEARALARYAVQRMGIRRFAILYPDVESARVAMKVFWATVTRLGGEVRAAHSFPLHAEDFTDPIRKLVGRYHLEIRQPSPHWRRLNRKGRHRGMHYPPLVDYEALYIPAPARVARRILPRLLYWDVELRSEVEMMEDDQLMLKYRGDPPPFVQLLGGSQFNHPDIARVRPAQNAVFLDSFWEGAVRSDDFVRLWREETKGYTPPALAAHAYDAFALLAPAVKGLDDRAEIRRAMLKHEHNGLFGWTRFQGNGEAAFDMHVLTLNLEQGIVARTYEAN